MTSDEPLTDEEREAALAMLRAERLTVDDAGTWPLDMCARLLRAERERDEERSAHAASREAALETVHALERQIAERDRVIAELLAVLEWARRELGSGRIDAVIAAAKKVAGG